ncbi:flagellar basal body-associated FliL family protein [Geminicoccus flavidas]|uniref:flagellar basal body-associated FliL family protein n=1 Tax=Geminicoccus flavidas TaxID=2506407 RepID=UPI0013567712|nr:flagellar basal body-associated FliL family protein [Geminicoccus flavidas]
MADKAKEPAAAAEKAGGGRGKLMMFGLIGLLALAGAGGAGAYLMGLFSTAPPAAAAALPDPAAGTTEEVAPTPAAGEHDAAPAAPKVIFVDLPDVLVNLSSDSKRMRFLKLRLAVEVSSQATADTVVQYTPRIMDSFQLYLRSLTVDDLGGPSALHRLKQEMLARINLALDPGRIDDVLFKEMLVQ